MTPAYEAFMFLVMFFGMGSIFLYKKFHNHRFALFGCVSGLAFSIGMICSHIGDWDDPMVTSPIYVGLIFLAYGLFVFLTHRNTGANDASNGLDSGVVSALGGKEESTDADDAGGAGDVGDAGDVGSGNADWF